MTRLPRIFALAAFGLSAACDGAPGWPDLPLPPESGADGDFPALVPLEPLLDRARAQPAAPPTADLPARLDGLARRATALRGPVIPAPERTRIDTRARLLRAR